MGVEGELVIFPEAELVTYLGFFVPDGQVEPLLDRIAQTTSDDDDVDLVRFLYLAHLELETSGKVDRDNATVVLYEELHLPVVDIATVLDEPPAVVADRLDRVWAEFAAATGEERPEQPSFDEGTEAEELFRDEVGEGSPSVHDGEKAPYPEETLAVTTVMDTRYRDEIDPVMVDGHGGMTALGLAPSPTIASPTYDRGVADAMSGMDPVGDDGGWILDPSLEIVLPGDMTVAADLPTAQPASAGVDGHGEAAIDRHDVAYPHLPDRAQTGDPDQPAVRDQRHLGFDPSGPWEMKTVEDQPVMPPEGRIGQATSLFAGGLPDDRDAGAHHDDDELDPDLSQALNEALGQVLANALGAHTPVEPVTPVRSEGLDQPGLDQAAADQAGSDQEGLGQPGQSGTPRVTAGGQVFAGDDEVVSDPAFAGDREAAGDRGAGRLAESGLGHQPETFTKDRGAVAQGQVEPQPHPTAPGSLPVADEAFPALPLRPAPPMVEAEGGAEDRPRLASSTRGGALRDEVGQVAYQAYNRDEDQAALAQVAATPGQAADTKTQPPAFTPFTGEHAQGTHSEQADWQAYRSPRTLPDFAGYTAQANRPGAPELPTMAQGLQDLYAQLDPARLAAQHAQNSHYARQAPVPFFQPVDPAHLQGPRGNRPPVPAGPPLNLGDHPGSIPQDSTLFQEYAALASAWGQMVRWGGYSQDGLGLYPGVDQPVNPDGQGAMGAGGDQPVHGAAGHHKPPSDQAGHPQAGQPQPGQPQVGHPQVAQPQPGQMQPGQPYPAQGQDGGHPFVGEGRPATPSAAVPGASTTAQSGIDDTPAALPDTPALRALMRDLPGAWIAGGEDVLAMPVSPIPLGGRVDIPEPPANPDDTAPNPRISPAYREDPLVNDEAVTDIYVEAPGTYQPVAPPPVAVWIPGMVERAFRQTPWKMEEDDQGAPEDLHGFALGPVARPRTSEAERAALRAELGIGDAEAFMAQGHRPADDWDRIQEGRWARADYGPKRRKANRAGQVMGLLAVLAAGAVGYTFMTWPPLMTTIDQFNLPVPSWVLVVAVAGVLAIGGISMFIGSSITKGKKTRPPKPPKAAKGRAARRTAAPASRAALDEAYYLDKDEDDGAELMDVYTDGYGDGGDRLDPRGYDPDGIQDADHGDDLDPYLDDHLGLPDEPRTEDLS